MLPQAVLRPVLVRRRLAHHQRPRKQARGRTMRRRAPREEQRRLPRVQHPLAPQDRRTKRARARTMRRRPPALVRAAMWPQLGRRTLPPAAHVRARRRKVLVHRARLRPPVMHRRLRVRHGRQRLLLLPVPHRLVGRRVEVTSRLRERRHPRRRPMARRARRRQARPTLRSRRRPRAQRPLPKVLLARRRRHPRQRPAWRLVHRAARSMRRNRSRPCSLTISKHSRRPRARSARRFRLQATHRPNRSSRHRAVSTRR